MVLCSRALQDYNHSFCFSDTDLLGTRCLEDVAVLPCHTDLCAHLHVLISLWALFLLKVRGWRAAKPEGGHRELALCLTHIPHLTGTTQTEQALS